MYWYLLTNYGFILTNHPKLLIKSLVKGVTRVIGEIFVKHWFKVSVKHWLVLVCFYMRVQKNLTA